MGPYLSHTYWEKNAKQETMNRAAGDRLSFCGISRVGSDPITQLIAGRYITSDLACPSDSKLILATRYNTLDSSSTMLSTLRGGNGNLCLPRPNPASGTYFQGTPGRRPGEPPQVPA